MAVVGGSLNGQLPSRSHQGQQPGNGRVMIVYPLDDGVGENQVPLTVYFFQIAQLEAWSEGRSKERLRKFKDAAS
jgi:hypothetical protein